jgi:MoaA/NifB/PqqE/SkfB family radical SAM enzyme
VNPIQKHNELVKNDSPSQELTERLLLDGTKIGWHKERVDAWLRGEKIAPITIDMALTRTCNYACKFCYATLQENQRHPITKDVMTRFIDDCAEMGVKGISLVSDGESTLNTAFVHTIQYGDSRGISMAVGSNAYLLDEAKIRAIMPHLTYFRVNITAGEPKRYEEIMGVKPGYFEKVCENIKTMMRVKKETGSKCTVGMQMVLMPEFEDQILPLANLAVQLQPDYLVIKHCSDDEDGSLGVNYDGYTKMYEKLKTAESMSTDTCQIHVKWSKIGDKGTRSYERCYGPPFLIQLSGSGLVAPCGMMFNEQYKKFHIGNITKESFKDMVKGERYWEVVNYLASPNFNAKIMCGSLCLQHKVNEALDGVKNGKILEPSGKPPQHINFI